ncbi:MAG: hypothetical protein ABSE56_02495 [Bryobacteraceae bacterium]
MAIKVKDAATSAAKFSTRAAAAAQDYATGVAAAGQDWETGTVAAEPNYEAAIQDAITRKSFSKGVRSAGGAKFATNASTTGASRFPQGVRSAQGTWQSGVAPYLQTIAGVQLPPRRPKGDPANMARVQAVTDALRKKKVSG